MVENDFNIADHLPLRLIRSEIIPPAPNRTNSGSESAIDWLCDFAGYTWIAYGASSLLVISHFPNPLSESETLIGPIFRQVFELSVDGTGIVSAVSWSPAMPSVGDLAAALDNCIGVFSYNRDIASNSSFCWSQSAILVQTTKAEVIKWTVSGDGIIVGGIEVVLWRKREKSWETAWKFKPTVPHTLVAASWSIEGPLATAPLGFSSAINETSNYVLVNYGHGDSKNFQSQLRHPSAISMVQWRPSTGRPVSKDARHLPRLMLLTSCLDGSVRLWSENDDGKVRKAGKDSYDPKMAKLSFRVVAVIEVDQALNGTLGSSVFVMWATEIDGIAGIDKCHFSSPDYQYDKTGCCEWLIGFGPQLVVTLWAIHCLDDFSPLRFPRVTLWKRQELISPQVGCGGFLLNKVFIRRNNMFSSPTMCSLLEVLPCNSLAFLHLHSQISSDTQERSTNNCHSKDLLISHALGILDVDSHTGSILKVVVHPYLFEVGLAASLDTNGLLLFWSLSTASIGVAGLRTLHPSSILSGRGVFSESHAKYTSLVWAPAILNEDRVLIMGHTGGIDCLIVKVMDNEEYKIAYHHLCTIPYGSEDFDQGPNTLSSIPLPSTCNKTFVSNSFMVLAVWKNNFRALSWKMTMHHHDLPRNCFDCSCDSSTTAENNLWTFESDFSGKRYCISIHPYSSILPSPYDKDMISSFAVIHPNYSFSSEEQEWNSADEFSSSYSTYHVVTGCTDGSVKLWRSLPEKLSSTKSLWDLVGVLAAHQGPVLAISPSVCGRKLASVSAEGRLISANTLRVWECVRLGSGGHFILEDTICFDGEVVALNWLMLGDGNSLLGVCTQNELKIYAQRCCGGQDSLKSEEPVDGNIWVCIAVTFRFPVIHDFFWGPKAIVGVVHLDYFSLFSPFSLLDKNNPSFCHTQSCTDTPFICNGGSNEYLLPTVFIDSGISDADESSVKNCDGQLKSGPSMNMNAKDNLPSLLGVERSKQNFNFDFNITLWSLSEVAQKLGGSLSVFHPEALLLNISTGNWKRAYVTLQHVAENITSAKIYGKRYCFGKDSHVISQVPLSNYLEGLFSSSSGDKSFQWDRATDGIVSSTQFQNGAFTFPSSWDYSATSNALPSSSTRSEPTDFVDVLGKLYDSASITNTEKMQMHAIIDILQEVGSPHTASVYGSLDETGRRFWVAVRFQRLYFAKRYGKLPLAGESVVSSGLIGWAFHSDCGDNLFNSLLSNEPSWQEMRDVGIGYWYTNTAQLRLKMERLARQQYLKAKDPKACALLYIALNRIQVLAGLFKISKDEKNKPLVAFLSRNFQDEKNKAAALKNAYVLMGKHQLELAIAFFLLGGDTNSAVTICARNFGDEQLALVICRLVEGYGGPLEHYLISKIILPSAVSRGDYWLTSLFEWMLGNYAKAYLSMLGVQTNLTNNESAVSTRQKSFLDPSIGQYCLMLANKTNMKNAIGEQKAAVLSRWALLTSAIALSRCGLPLKALECLSSCLNALGASNERTESIVDNGDIELLNEVLKLSPTGNSLNWISCDLAKHKELHAKSDLAMQYLSQLLKEHPSWRDINMLPSGDFKYMESTDEEYKRSIENFNGKLTATLQYFQQKFSLNPFHLIDKIVLFLSSNGLQFIGYHILGACVSRFLSPEQTCGYDGFFSYPIMHKLLLRMSEEVSIVSRYVVSSSISFSHLLFCSTKSVMATESRSHLLLASEYYQWILIRSLWCLRATVKLFFGSSTEDILFTPLTVIDLAEYYIYFVSAWSQMNLRRLALIIEPILFRFNKGDSPQDILKDINKNISEIRKIFADNLQFDNVGASEINEVMQHEQGGGIITKIPEDDRWLVIGFSFCGQISSFLKHLLNFLIEKLEESCSVPSPREAPVMPNLSLFGPDGKNIELPTAMLPFSKLLDATCSHISFCCVKQLASYFLQKGDTRSTTILLSSEADHSVFGQRVDNINIGKNKTELSPSDNFWLICADPKIIPGFVKENLKWFECIKRNSSGRWIDVYTSILRECEGGETGQEDDRLGSPSKAAGSPIACLTPNEHPFLVSGGKDTEKVVPFNTPKDIYKRSGELLEALCINSIDQRQAALATNRKGIIYFNWEDGLPCGDGSRYIWADVDWPQRGWAGSESTPVPTCVYPGVGLGSRKGAHLGLGGATVGAGHLAKSCSELKDGRAFGVPVYSGLGISSLGWGIQEDFEEFIDPTPTAGSVNTSSFSAHPSRPLFLVGSSNTHVYLWEFGKDRATATYGVLPAANVPPPYALASISAVKFDHCGHRFVTAALDGTVCTWQVEVGGRSNVGPTESSTCFDNHTLDVTYVTPSGSIIAAAGYSSTGINVVIWDTLAPTATSRASIMCHEGGARSLSVFDHNLGGGSISPLIVTGGKAGDVGLHDFRYIATGRTKKHKHTDISEQNVNTSSTVDMRNKSGDQNRNGMLWYIPKAHAASVTKISTIPNTSLFLTGSKDGDVKLWDAKRARLVFHWPRLHERHTFLQPSSRGFGGVVRAAVTDIQVVSHGFLTCGGDGTVKLIKLKDFSDF
ncbi:hypothetical protein ACH5RR_024210 [Cinchona calisaya]|uniref:RAVE complex protein Rav1 C-terminal domain-containing protein n=1 Tax=Cinchona calisaya TaxID=153742 RepID=A0ABD2ZHW0_9GENT